MELMTINECAEESRMSASWWRQRIFHKEIEYLKIGRSVRIPRTTLDRVLAEAKVEQRRRRSGSEN